MVKWCPSRYCHHFLTAAVMAASSQTYVDESINLGQNYLLKKEMGWPPRVNTAPMPDPDAFVSTTKGTLKLGKARTGVAVIASLRF